MKHACACIYVCTYVIWRGRGRGGGRRSDDESRSLGDGKGGSCLDAVLFSSPRCGWPRFDTAVVASRYHPRTGASHPRLSRVETRGDLLRELRGQDFFYRRSTLDIRRNSRWKLTVINELSQLAIRGTIVALVKQHARLSRLCLKRADIDADGGIWTILSVRANKWILGDFAKEQR